MESCNDKPIDRDLFADKVKTLFGPVLWGFVDEHLRRRGYINALCFDHIIKEADGRYGRFGLDLILGNE